MYLLCLLLGLHFGTPGSLVNSLIFLHNKFLEIISHGILRILIFNSFNHFFSVKISVNFSISHILPDLSILLRMLLKNPPPIHSQQYMSKVNGVGSVNYAAWNRLIDHFLLFLVIFSTCSWLSRLCCCDQIFSNIWVSYDGSHGQYSLTIFP